MEDYLSSLNKQQRDAVEYIDGPELVIAGAGSGKTRVLTHKIMHLMCHGYEPWRILAMTFTNKAAREMRERIASLLGEKEAQKLQMGTFHSVFLRIIRRNAVLVGFKPGITIYDTSDSKALIKMLVKDMGLNDKFYKTSTVMSSISDAKNHLISPDRYAASPDIRSADKAAGRPAMADIYRLYMARCRAANAMDFDDLLYYTYELFANNPDVLGHYQEFFRYILVDEYQDTNYAQHMIVSMLAGENPRFCVVGDDAQSIYSFRGANIANILNLRNGYPDLAIFKLEQNYRSTRNIINAANSLIAKNTRQIAKNIFSNNGLGDPVEVVATYSDFEESVVVANRISQVRMETSDPYSEFAVLYRTNAQSRILEESLRKRNIPYRIWGGLSFYQRKEVKDCVAYFRLVVNHDDDEALRRVINTPARGIGETTLKKLTHCAIEHACSIWDVITAPEGRDPGLNKAAWRKIDGFVRLVDDLSEFERDPENDAYDTARKIIDSSGLLAELLSEHTPETISRRENITELLGGVNEFVESRREQGIKEIRLLDFLGEVQLATDQDASDEDDEKVTLMTVHAAKGLEFNNVFVVGVEDDLFPSAMSKDSFDSVEEERRLLYVALTRARNFCMLSYATSRYRNGQTTMTVPSPFLRDISPDYLNAVRGASLAASPSRMASRGAASYHSPGRGQSVSAATGPSHARRPWEENLRSRPAPAPEAGGDFGLHDVAEIAVGMTIEHQRFGAGTVTAIDTSQADARIHVAFNDAERVLMLKYARFRIG